jgi:DNA-binding transcriptional MerR regulator
MPPIPAEQVSPYAHRLPHRLLPAAHVATRYGVHLRTVSRWVARGVIPPPDQVINGRRYWLFETLEQADRRRTVEAGASLSPTPSS